MMYEKLLEKLSCLAIIWEYDDGVFHCKYHNKLITTDNTFLLSNHMKNIKNPDEYLKKINLVVNESVEQEIKDEITIIILNKIYENKIFEVHYPNPNNINILTVISHKIRIPLTNIIGILALLEDTHFDKQSKQYIEILKKSSSEIIKIVNNLADIISYSKNEMTIVATKTSIQNIITSTYQIIKHTLNDKKVAIKFNIDPQIPNVIIVDKYKLKQLLINIINNSIKNTDIGTIIVDVHLNKNINEAVHIQCEKTLYNILFKIRDTGVGIDDSKKKIISKIIGGNFINTHQYYGYYGFGLMISKYICDLMGGRIWFKSEIDMGTIFYFNIICEGIYMDV
jgi:signal transduction histidine kinase